MDVSLLSFYNLKLKVCLPELTNALCYIHSEIVVTGYKVRSSSSDRILFPNWAHILIDFVLLHRSKHADGAPLIPVSGEAPPWRPAGRRSRLSR